LVDVDGMLIEDLCRSYPDIPKDLVRRLAARLGRRTLDDWMVVDEKK